MVRRRTKVSMGERTEEDQGGGPKGRPREYPREIDRGRHGDD